MKTLLFTILFVFPGLCAFSQLDYHKIKDTIYPGGSACGINDSAALHTIYPKLLAIDTTLISEGIAEYYNDLANVLTGLALYHDPDTTYWRLSLTAIEHYLYYEPDDFSMIWNAGFNCVSLKDCEKAHDYLNRYYQTAPRKYWKKDQIEAFLYFCPDDELRRKFKIKEKTPR